MLCILQIIEMTWQGKHVYQREIEEQWHIISTSTNQTPCIILTSTQIKAMHALLNSLRVWYEHSLVEEVAYVVNIAQLLHDKLFDVHPTIYALL